MGSFCADGNPSKAFMEPLGKIPSGMSRRNPFPSWECSVSGCHPGVLPCSVLAPCRIRARSVRNNWVSSARPLNISWIFLPDLSQLRLTGTKECAHGTRREFCPRQLGESGRAPGRSGARESPGAAAPKVSWDSFAAGRNLGRKNSLPKQETWEYQ